MNKKSVFCALYQVFFCALWHLWSGFGLRWPKSGWHGDCHSNLICHPCSRLTWLSPSSPSLVLWHCGDIVLEILCRVGVHSNFIWNFFNSLMWKVNSAILKLCNCNWIEKIFFGPFEFELNWHWNSILVHFLVNWINALSIKHWPQDLFEIISTYISIFPV
jgi:hypothetical protein